MRRSTSFAIAIASVSAIALTAIGPANATCRKMGFLVNDYGKDGPTKDAQELLEKDIAKWAAGQGIAKYTVTKKDVSCELFLNFIVFDEHTCTASANVCWDEKTAGKPATTAAAPAVEKTSTEAAAKPDSKSEKTATTGDTKPDAKKPAAAEAKPAKDSAKVETGTVSAKATGAAATAAASPVIGQPAAASPEKDPSQAAAAAAERAAAAAERAAVAAERAAQAAMDAQNQGSQGSAPAVETAPATTASSETAAPAVVKPITPLPSSAAP